MNRTQVTEEASEKLVSATRMLLRGYVVYDVHDDPAQKPSLGRHCHRP